MAKFQRVKGTEDFYPEEMSFKNSVFSKLKKTATKYNFLEVETPALETVDLLTAKSGEEIKEQIFVLKKRSKEELGLRFDLTIPAARMYIEKQKSIPKPAKWFYLTRMWRYEQPQKGRLREFYQFGIEIFGSKNPQADAQVISVANQSLLSLRLKNSDFLIKVNNRKLLEGIVEDYVKKNKLESVIRLIDKKSKISPKEFETGLRKEGVKKIKELIKLINIKDSPSKAFEELSKSNLNKKATQGLQELKSVCDLLKISSLIVDLSTARGLAYYTGTVFEIFDKEEKYRAICGGGRYDELIGLLGGENDYATGFGMGFSTLSLLLMNKGLFPKIDLGPDYLVIPVNKDMIKKSIEVGNILRENYIVDIDLMNRNLSNQLSYANTIGAKNIVIVGPKDLADDCVTIKELDTGFEKKIKIEDLLL
ncbi:histidine--tRNA ligase [Candidatus Woesearchaeota archaeon]|nr:histidine--tRNA ligase [Candidatus Woesearchaeota archaeon]